MSKDKIQEVLGEHFVLFQTANLLDFAEEVVDKLTKEMRHRSIGLCGVVSDGVSVAVMYEHHNWGSSGGIQWDFEVDVRSSDDHARLFLFAMRARSSSKYDFGEYWYSKPTNVQTRINSRQFVVCVDNKHWWHLGFGKNIWISKDHQSWRHELKAEEQGVEASIKLPDGSYVSPPPSSWDMINREDFKKQIQQSFPDAINIELRSVERTIDLGTIRYFGE